MFRYCDPHALTNASHVTGCSILLSGSVRAPADMGEFKFASFNKSKPMYRRDDGAHLYWYEGKNEKEKEWRVWKEHSSGSATFNTVSGDDVATPDLVTKWRTKSDDGWQAEKISIRNTCAKSYTASPTPSPTSIEYAAAPDFGPSSPPTTLSKRYPQAGFGILSKPNPSTKMKQVPLQEASPRDFTWLHNVSQCVDLLQTAQRDAIRKAEASKATPEEMCGSQIQLLPEQECGQRSYADHELEWAVISYDVEFAPFRTGNAEQPTFCYPVVVFLLAHGERLCRRSMAPPDGTTCPPNQSTEKRLRCPKELERFGTRRYAVLHPRKHTPSLKF